MKRKRTPLQFGDRFGLWTVIGRDGSRNRPAVLCLCDCGNTAVVFEQNLTRHLSTKCRDCAWVTHGQTRGEGCLEYRSWSGMKSRCLNPNAPNFRLYGGRGISITPRWVSKGGFERFLSDVGRRPSPEHSLDRYPDKNGNYEPGNVRWATKKEQARNTNWNRILTAGGESLSVAEWAEKLNVNPNKLHNRISLGWPVERVLQLNVCADKTKA